MPVGSIRKLCVNNITLSVKTDSNFKETIGKYDTEVIMGTNGPTPKFSLRAEMVENIYCIANREEKYLVKEIADSGAWVPCLYTDPDGVTISASCIVVITDANTADGLLQLKLIPKDGWS